MRLAWFTPLPPMPSGIADYSYELVPYVAEQAEVELYCPRPRWLRRARAPRGIRVRRPREYASVAGSYDATYYHLGNNPHHEFVYDLAKDRPEIAVFHDAVLHHLIAAITMEIVFDPVRYGDILELDYGEDGRRLAALRRSGLASEFEKFLFPATGHVARRAKGIVVHSADSARRLSEVAPHVPIEVIPHHAGEPPVQIASITREHARRQLNLPEDAFVVGHFGFITRPKQPAAVVKGFAMLRERYPDALLLMVGADHTGGALERLLDLHGLRPAVRLAGFQESMVPFYRYLRAVDAVVNLRYPSAGESSGTMARAIAEGKPVIVNNYAAFAEVPGDVALKVEIDGDQGEQVGDHLLRLAGDPGFRALIGRNARAYAHRAFDPVTCARQYVEFAERVAARSGADVLP